MRVLGEDPEEFRELHEGLRQEWHPSGPLQERLVGRLARALWQADRYNRMQEGHAIERARKVDRAREDRFHARMLRLQTLAASLAKLVESVQGYHYIATPEDLQLIEGLYHEDLLGELGSVVLALFYELREPGTQQEPPVPDSDVPVWEMRARARRIFGLPPIEPPDATVGSARGAERATGEAAPRVSTAPVPSPASTHEAGVPVAANILPLAPSISPPSTSASSHDGKGEEGSGDEDEFDVDFPQVTADEWKARESLRQLLENLLKRKQQACEAERSAFLQESLAGPTPYERAAEITPTERGPVLSAHRLEEFGFRQIWRITNLLTKLKDQDRKGLDQRAGGLRQEKSTNETNDVYENKRHKKRHVDQSNDVYENEAG